MPGPLVNRGRRHLSRWPTVGPRHITREPSALVDDTFAAREGHVSPYAHCATLTELSPTRHSSNQMTTRTCEIQTMSQMESTSPNDPFDLSKLSPSERQVLERARSGSTAIELARQLSLTEATVRTHLSHIYEKLGVRGRVELLSRLQRNSLPSIDQPVQSDGPVRGVPALPSTPQRVGSPATTTTSRGSLEVGLEALVSVLIVGAFWLGANALHDPRIVLSSGVAVGIRRGVLGTSRVGDVVGLAALATAEWFTYLHLATPDSLLGTVLALVVSTVTFGSGYLVGRAAAQVCARDVHRR
jgi:DNA-binding CsgD family transcriptional regulator